MASKACSSCLRALQRQSIPQTRRTATRLVSRTLTTSTTRRSAPEYSQPPATSLPPVTLQVAEGGPNTNADPSASAVQLKNFLGRTAETYTAYGATETMYKECALQADYSIPQAKDEEVEMPKTEDGEDLGTSEGGWWHTELGLKPTFSTWSQVTMLHMYLLSARFRCFPPTSAQPWQQHLIDHFFYDAENKMTIEHNMHARGTRNKYLKDIYVQWRGLLAAYDEGLARGDAVLAAAIWRNVFKASADVDVRGLAQIVSYMKRHLSHLDSLSDEQVMGIVLEFGSPGREKSLVDSRDKMMDLPIEQAPGTDLSGSKRE